MIKKRPRPKRRDRMPSKRDIQMHLKRHARVHQVLTRLVKDLEKTRRDVANGAKPEPGSKEAAMIINDIIEAIGLAIRKVIACIGLYSEMSELVDLIDDPNVPADAKKALHQALGGLIESAAALGCP